MVTDKIVVLTTADSEEQARLLARHLIEHRLAACPGVRQVALFGIPSALRNEEAIACVAGAVEAEVFLQFARSILSGWQVPRDVWLVDELPVNERGKISRRDLARAYLAARQMQS